MDPYLEDPSLWMDFHGRFITYCSDFLNARLPDDYDTLIEERISLVELSAEESKSYREDVALLISSSGAAREGGDWPVGGGPSAMIAEPVTIPQRIYDEIRESNIQIFDRRNHRLVTVIELFSPTNKTTGFQQYIVKRNSILRTDTHLVEIDLLIGGKRLPLELPLPAGHYFTYVSRCDRRPDCDVFASSIRERLPMIPIPLSPPDPDLESDLQELFSFTYDRGRYWRMFNVSAPPPVTLAAEDLQWVSGLAKG
jgi:Protein of unknown function (DUF4058)